VVKGYKKLGGWDAGNLATWKLGGLILILAFQPYSFPASRPSGFPAFQPEKKEII
jgi:hypothetical protein